MSLTFKHLLHYYPAGQIIYESLIVMPFLPDFEKKKHCNLLAVQPQMLIIH